MKREWSASLQQARCCKLIGLASLVVHCVKMGRTLLRVSQNTCHLRFVSRFRCQNSKRKRLSTTRIAVGTVPCVCVGEMIYTYAVTVFIFIRFVFLRK